MHFDPVTGLIHGNGAIKTTWAELEQQLVQGKLPVREELYAQLTKYNAALSEQIGTSFRQWIDGSFATAASRPKDIDLVCFIPRVAIASLEQLESFKQPYCAFLGLDAYIVLTYGPSDPRHSLALADEGYWNDKFRKTRLDRFGRSKTKAFLELEVLTDGKAA